MLRWVLAFVLVYFAVGAFAVLKLRAKLAPETNRALELKYWVYLVVVCLTVGVLALGGAAVLMLTLGLVGSFEVVSAGNVRRPALRALGVFFVTFLSVGCILGASNAPVEGHLFVYLVVFVFDGFSQIAGQLFGRRKLSPGVSPQKTVEGFLGGLLVASLTGALCGAALSDDADLSRMKWAYGSLAGVFAVGICLLGLAGDLAASWLKRRLAIKDYGRSIPGHGGALDRFDSLLMVGGLVGWVLWVVTIYTPGR